MFDEKAYQKQYCREYHRKYMKKHGYCLDSDKATGGLRTQILIRDGYKCLRCGMTDAEHRAKWSMAITIDHINRNRSENTMENLQTLCLVCNVKKDSRKAKVDIEPLREEILTARTNGEAFHAIARRVGVSKTYLWNAIQRWRRMTNGLR